jgi:asparagine synthase (glutamine-hydrolysing)
MLDGQGADEILAGYPGFIGPTLAGLLRSGKLLKLFREMQALRQKAGHSILRILMQFADTMLAEPIRQPLRRLVGVDATHPSWLDAKRLGVRERDPALEFSRHPRSLTDLSALLLLRTGVPMLLHSEDRNSMAHGVESRVPFLDYRLVEFTLGLPDRFKLEGGRTKSLLRNAMGPALPERVRERHNKLGFVTPEEIWIRVQAPETFRTWMHEAIGNCHGIIRTSALKRFEAGLSNHRVFDFVDWRIVNFAGWLRRFGVGPA